MLHERLHVFAQFDSKAARVESNTFDDVGKTKMSKKETSARGGWGFSGLWSGRAGSDDEDEKDSKRRVTIGGYASDSSDGDGPKIGASGGYFATGISADLRKAGAGLPDGVEIVGGDGAFEEQEDGDTAFVVPEGAYVKLTVPGMSPWQLEEDGRLHKYSLLVAMKVDRLP